MHKHPVLAHLMIMVGYSVLFMVLAALMPGDGGMGMVMAGWAVLGLHVIGLFIVGLIEVATPEKRAHGKLLLLASLVVAIIGHGLCFFNGLLNMGNIH
ncbi:MAG TPA: hypothetical protein VHL57_06910 [Flavobacteriales bacterium]|jgi:drug/metabolite transporter (DMT)-like permease|nr:hypothetical protein [Flavobacteriales bacterium]